MGVEPRALTGKAREHSSFQTKSQSSIAVFMTSPHTSEIAALRSKWGLLSSYPDILLADLVSRYSEPHRHYHTLDHIRALFSHLEAHQELASDRAAITAAICFHDAIYDTRRNDNELRSADLARGELEKIGWPAPELGKVAAMILATQHHNPPAPDADTLLFLDLDLSILGACAQAYDSYSAAIRREFEWVPDVAYAQGRSQVLKNFLKREAIFKTRALRELWEASARANLTRELSSFDSAR